MSKQTPAKDKQARSEALKRAQKKYYEQKRSKTQKTISITLTAEQVEADRQTMAEHNTTPAQVWREAMERLKAQPIDGESDSTDTATE